jgi:hypothetical protein
VLNVESLASGVPVPPVNPDDIKRLWRFISGAADKRQHIEGEASAPTMAFDEGLIAQQCSSGADVFAVFFRTALLQPLLRQGILNDWLEGNELRDTVFGAAATFPLQNGVESFDPNAFVERLRSSSG